MSFPNIATQRVSGEHAVEMGRLGGSQCTPAKRLAAKLRELRKRGMNDHTAQRLYELMTDSQLSALDALRFIDDIRSRCRTIDEEMKAAKLLNDWQKLHHGVKETIEHNVNINKRSVQLIINAHEAPLDSGADTLATDATTIVSLPLPPRPDNN